MADSLSRDSSCSIPVRVDSCWLSWNLARASRVTSSSCFVVSKRVSNSSHRISSCSFSSSSARPYWAYLNDWINRKLQTSFIRFNLTDNSFSLEDWSSSRCSRSTSPRNSSMRSFSDIFIYHWISFIADEKVKCRTFTWSTKNSWKVLLKFDKPSREKSGWRVNEGSN